MFDAWNETAQQAAAARSLADERTRHTMARLLQSRGHREEALIVAASGLRTDCVDNWNGGQYEVTLSVPVNVFDEARREERRVLLSAAAGDLIGEDSFQGLQIVVKEIDVEPGWEEAFAAEISRPPGSSEVHQLALPAGN